MELKLIRKWKKPKYTIGDLYINNEKFCNTLEDTDRGLSDNMSESDIKKIKVYSETAIPTGTYQITLNVIAGGNFQKPFYKQYANNCRVPRLLNVKGFSGILIHCGTNASHSAGCLLVGKNKIVGGLTDSKEVFKELYKKLQSAKDRKEKITITIE